MAYAYYFIMNCLTLLGVTVAFDASYAAVYGCDPTVQTCIPLLGNPSPIEGTDLCYLPALIDDPWYDGYWCADVDVRGVTVKTPCPSEATPWAQTPYEMRNWQNENFCNPWQESEGMCTRFEVVCNPSDAARGACEL